MNDLISSKDLVFNDFLHYPDLSIQKNEITFISGDSGCGKSTLLKLFNSTIAPSSGNILYNGEDISNIDKIKLRKEVLLVKQVPFLFKGTIHENFLAFHSFRENTCPSKDSISNFMEICCIPMSLETECDNMSGGERQRLFLSIALSLMPKVLLLDEPSSSLNKELSKKLLTNIIDYSRLNDISLIIISHDRELQEDFSEKTIKLGR